MNDTKGTVPREKYREVLDQRNQFKNMWHNKCEELEGYKEFQSVPKEDLRDLIKEWRATAYETSHKTVRQGKVLHHLVDELEKVLEE